MRRRASMIARRAIDPVSVGVALVLLLALLGAADAEELEYRVKAEFIERFTHFIEWPPTAFTSAASPFVLCVVGETPVTTYLARLAQRRRIKNRPVALLRLKASSDLSDCHMLFIASDERPYLRQILDRIDGRPIVTVADSEGFGRAGVLINLLLDAEGRIGFEISSSEARHTALTLSAPLLRLSRLSPSEPSR